MLARPAREDGGRIASSTILVAVRRETEMTRVEARSGEEQAQHDSAHYARHDGSHIQATESPRVASVESTWKRRCQPMFRKSLAPETNSPRTTAPLSVR